MKIDQSPAGRVIQTTTGYRAFIPHPLPPSFEWGDDLVNALSRADYLVGKLSREGAKLPDPHLLIHPFMTREAVLSSKIEGTQASVGEILASEVGAQVARDPNDLQEVKNYVEALDYGIRRLKELPLSVRLLKELHEKLMQGVRGQHATPGEFRKTQNWIGTPGCTLNTAKYVPPTVDELADCLGALEKFLHNRQLPTLIHAALCHYQFEAIHPFLDGNGRIGRLLMILLLIERGMLSSPVLYLSAFFEATRDDYYRLLYKVSSEGAWEEWLTYVLHGVATQSADVLSRAERINGLLADWQQQVKDGASKISEEIITYLAVNPFLTIKQIATHFGVAYTTSRRAVQKLESLGILSQSSKGKRDRVFCATKILSILEEPASLDGPIFEIG